MLRWQVSIREYLCGRSTSQQAHSALRTCRVRFSRMTVSTRMRAFSCLFARSRSATSLRICFSCKHKV